MDSTDADRCGARASTSGLRGRLPLFAVCDRAAGDHDIHRDGSPQALLEWIENKSGGVNWITAEEK